MSDEKSITDLTIEVLGLAQLATSTGDENIMNEYRKKSKELKDRLKKELKR